MEPVLLSIIDAASALGVGRSKVYQLIGTGELDTVALGRRRLVRVESLKALARGPAHAGQLDAPASANL